eukprot:Lithocolla_globosa_v1_NODE_4362_length_1453_cov_8.296137.p2 type:complete len:131 gc:universal NODE_4362_length_1453_cov_8.296137:945-1337(+)
MPPHTLYLFINAPRALFAEAASILVAKLKSPNSFKRIPRYLYSETKDRPISFPNRRIEGRGERGVAGPGRKWRSFVLVGFIRMRHLEHQLYVMSSSVCKSFSFSAIRTISSAYSKMLMISSPKLTPVFDV